MAGQAKRMLYNSYRFFRVAALDCLRNKLPMTDHAAWPLVR
jgi:hypothetical protein